jgi:hypothetical protein
MLFLLWEAKGELERGFGRNTSSWRRVHIWFLWDKSDAEGWMYHYEVMRMTLTDSLTVYALHNSPAAAGPGIIQPLRNHNLPSSVPAGGTLRNR